MGEREVTGSALASCGPVIAGKGLDAEWHSGSMISDSGVDVIAIDAKKLTSQGINKGRVLMADGQGGVEFNPMSTFEFNHNDLVESLSDKDKEELLDIIQRHRKTVEKIDDMMIDLLAGAELCSRVILESLNQAKNKTLQLISYALLVLTDDMDSIDALKKEKENESNNMEDIMKLLIGKGNPSVIASPATIGVPAKNFGINPSSMPGMEIGQQFPDELVDTTNGDPMPHRSLTPVAGTVTRQDSNTAAMNANFSDAASGGQ